MLRRLMVMRMRKVLVYAPLAADRLAIVQAAATSAELEIASSMADVIRGMSPGPTAIVISANDLTSCHLDAFLAHAALFPGPVLLFTTLTPPNARMVSRCIGSLLECRIGIRSFDSLARSVSNVLSSAPAPDLAILPPLLRKAASPSHGLIASAAIVGCKRVGVNVLAKACGISVRTLELRSLVLLRLHPRQLLAWMLALHAAWRIGEAGESQKEVALSVGFQSERAMSNRIERAVGLRLRAFRESGAFERCLDRFGDLTRAPAQ